MIRSGNFSPSPEHVIGISAYLWCTPPRDVPRYFPLPLGLLLNVHRLYVYTPSFFSSPAEKKDLRVLPQLFFLRIFSGFFLFDSFFTAL